MSKKPILYIIDGSSYIFRAYYAIPHLSNSKGLPTNAVLGFTQMLLKLLKEEKPDHLVMVFDSKEPTFRKQAYEAYKANREAPPDDLIPQFDYIKKVVSALNIPQLEMPGYEADDIIATIAKKLVPPENPVVIVTGDKDLMQLVNHHIVLLDTMKEKKTDIPGVHAKFGVSPEQVVDVLALMGDASDNIPGVPGIGPKTATQLIQQYGSLEKVYEHLEELKGKKGELLKANQELAFLSKRLVTLHEDVPLKYQYEDFQRRELDQAACRELFETLEFHRLLSELVTPQKALPSGNYQLVHTTEMWNQFFKRLKETKAFSFDTETSSLDFLKAKLVGLSFAFKAGEAYYLPLGHRTLEPQLETSQVLKDLQPIFENSTIVKFAQNYKYDAHVLKNHGLEVRGAKCDTMLASYLLDPATSHKLDALSLRYLGHKMISYDEVTKKKGGGDFAEVSLQEATTYSCEDADVTLQLAKIFHEKMNEAGLQELFNEVELPLTEVLLKMERRGIKIDEIFLLELQKEFGERMREKEAKIYELAEETFNIQSPKQLAQILFGKLKLSSVKKTKTGHSTDVEVLTELAKVHGLPQEILDFRSLAKLKSTYVDALLVLRDPQTHRIHTSFNQTIAETGRLSSSDPNLQNIPIRSEDGAKIRRAFIAEPGFHLMSADYSQIELRVLAHLSKDELLREAFQENQDIHRLTAANIFQVSEAMVTPQMRAAGKTVNFAVVYGQTPYGLSQQLGVSQQQAKKYIDQYFQKYEGVQKYRDAILHEAREKKEVRTLMGRRRFVPDIVSKNAMAKNFAERIAFNTVIQGTAADLIKKAMVNIDRRMLRQGFLSHLLLQVHDELVFEVENSECQTMSQMIREEMEGVAKFDVPLRVEIGEGANWAEAHS